MSTMTQQDKTAPVPAAPWQQMILTERLHPNPDNPRIDPGDLDGLRASILENGLKQRLLVRPAPGIGDGEYYIEDGWRRYLAMKDHFTSIPCDVQPSRHGDPVKRDVITALVTDVQRKNLNPMERADGFAKLRELGMSQPQIARVTGLHVSTVSDGLALQELTPDTQERVREGKLSAVDALKIVQRYRKAQRRKNKQPERGAQWDPDHFAPGHKLARAARILCDADGDNRRRRKGGACDYHWEMAIRADQDRITRELVKLEAEARDRVQGKVEAAG